MSRYFKRRFQQVMDNLVPVLLFVSFLIVIQICLVIKVVGSEVSHTGQYANIARGKPYTLQPKPNYALCTDPDDAIQLTDGDYTSGYFWMKKSTVGWLTDQLVIITIDLGQVEPIRGVSYNTAAGGAEVTWPISISVLVSDDGKNYNAVGDLVSLSSKHGTPPAQGYAVHRYWTDEIKAHGRYVQFIIENDGRYCFADEVEVFRGSAVSRILSMRGAQTMGGTDYFKDKMTNSGVRARLQLDLQEAKEAINTSGLNEQTIAPLLRELADIEGKITDLPHVNPLAFRAVMPINDLEARIFAVQGKLHRLQGSPELQAWVSHPYDYLTPTQGPDKNAKDQITVAMMRDEWRYAVVNLMNSSDKPISVHLRVEDLPGGVNPDFINVYSVEWTDTGKHKPIAAALVEAKRDTDDYLITIPAGMVRQVWFSLHPVKVPAGNYVGKVVIEYSGNKYLTVPMTVQLFPMTFPQQPTLHLGGWDYTDGIQFGVTEANRNALTTHLQERFVDSPWGTSAVLAKGGFDTTGNMTAPSTQRFDTWVERWPQARRYCVFVAVSDSLAGAKIDTPEFYVRVKAWIDFWVNHAALKGIKPEQLVLLLLDEPSKHEQDKIIIAWAKAIREAQPRVMLWEDPVHEQPQQAMPEMMAAVDVLCPNRTQLLKRSKEFMDFYQKQRAEGRHIELYSCSGPIHLLDPYSYVRLQAWSCWVMGAESTNFWSFGDTGDGSPWQPYTIFKKNYAPMFLSNDSVTPGKHMEAMRESVEDYEYFVMLRRALATANPNNPAVPRAKELLLNGAQRVLDAPGASKISWFDPKDRWSAEEVRLEILYTIRELQDS